MRLLFSAAILALLVAPAYAQSWEYWAGVDAVIAPDDDYFAPTIMADTERFHLEARYNYEGMNTTSLWGGYNIRSADEESWVITPMLGVAFGDTEGVLPGAEAIVNWKALDLYVELEHLFASDDESDDFTYSWAEFAVSPTDWLRAGIVTQSTWPAGETRTTQTGALLGVSYRDATITSFFFEDETTVVTVAIEF